MKPIFKYERKASPEPVMLAKTCSACHACNPCASAFGACNPFNPGGDAKVAAEKFTRPSGVEVGTTPVSWPKANVFGRSPASATMDWSATRAGRTSGHSTIPSPKPIRTKWRWLRNKPAWVKSPRTQWLSSVCWYRCSKTRRPVVRVA